MADINLGVGGANSAVAGGYDIDNSLKLEADNAEYLYYTPSGQTDYERMAFSIWVKRTELGDGNLAEFGNGTANTSNLRIGFDSSDRLFCYGNSIIWRQTNQVFRDTSAWYHLFFLFDTTTPGGISNNRIRIWVNGEMIPHTEFGVINNPGSGAAMGFNNALQQSIGAQREGGPTNYFKGYIAQAYGSGGTPPVVTDFGEVDEDTGIWKPIDISELTPPDTAGFNLDFSDASNLGNDISTRNNDFTLQNITSADQATDTPTNNFCTWNPLQNYDGKHLYRDGATTFDLNTNSGSGNSALGSMAFTKGKWYAEFKPKDATTSYPYNVFIGAGVMDQLQLLSTGFLGGKANSTAQGAGYYNANGKIYRSGASVAWGDTYVGDDIISVAFDYRSDGTAHMYVAKNGTWQNSSDPANDTNPITLNGGSAFADNTFISLGASIYVHDVLTIECNFGGYTPSSISTPATDENGYGTFEYAPPSGYYALCTKNLAEYG